MAKKIISVLLCLLWMWFIFSNSSKNGSESNAFSNKILDKIITEIKGNGSDNSFNGLPVFYNKEKLSNDIKHDVNGKTIDINQFVDDLELKKPSIFIRKNAHAFEFFVLAILVAFVFQSFNMKRSKSIIYILFIVLLYAVSDEFHQMFIQGRNSNVFDVVVDFIGGVAGTTLYILSSGAADMINSKFKIKKQKETTIK